MTGWSQDNILILTAAKAPAKGGGINAILGLLQDMIAFMDKVATTAESQDLGDNKQKLEKLHQQLAESYGSLLEMAKGGVKSIRQPVQQNEQPVMMGNNTIEQLP